MRTDTQALIARYLKELERELVALPRSRRTEVMDDVRAHISEARADSGDDEMAVRELLDRLGDPAEIAAEARERFGIHPVRVGFVEVMALILLPIGGVILPIIGWIAGVIFLWVSPAWTTRDKVIGTLLVPGGLLGALMMGATTYTTSCGGSIDGRGRNIEIACGPTGLGQLGFWLLFGILVIAPFATAVYLGVRLRRRPAAS